MKTVSTLLNDAGLSGYLDGIAITYPVRLIGFREMNRSRLDCLAIDNARRVMLLPSLYGLDGSKALHPLGEAERILPCMDFLFLLCTTQSQSTQSRSI